MVEPLLEARGLGVRLGMRRRFLRKDDKGYPILSNINFTMQPGEILALVGESGSGKTTLGRAIAGLTQIQAGSLLFQGQPIVDPSNIATIRTKDRAWYPRWQAYRKDIQMIFQDPLSSLNPRRSIGQSLDVPLRNFGAAITVDELFDQVGLTPEFKGLYPHRISGGQRQRVGIARALAGAPKLIIADEVVSGLDVSNQARILRLLLDLRDQRGPCRSSLLPMIWPWYARSPTGCWSCSAARSARTAPSGGCSNLRATATLRNCCEQRRRRNTTRIGSPIP